MFEENQEVKDPNFGLGQVITKFISGSVSVLFDSQLGDYHPVEVVYNSEGKIKQFSKGEEGIDVDKLYKTPSLIVTGRVRHIHDRFRKRFCLFKKDEAGLIDTLEKVEEGKYYGRSGVVCDEFFRPLSYEDLRIIL